MMSTCLCLLRPLRRPTVSFSFPSAWCRTVRPESFLRVLQYDPHSPSEARVNVPLQNFPQFSEAFQCKRTAPPDEFQGCVVW